MYRKNYCTTPGIDIGGGGCIGNSDDGGCISKTLKFLD